MIEMPPDKEPTQMDELRSMADGYLAKRDDCGRNAEFDASRAVYWKQLGQLYDELASDALVRADALDRIAEGASE